MYPLCITLLLFTQFSPLVLSPYPLLLPLDMLVSLALSGAVFEFCAHYYYLPFYGRLRRGGKNIVVMRKGRVLRKARFNHVLTRVLIDISLGGILAAHF